MTLAFDAKFVSCADAIVDEILQVTFDTVPAGKHEYARSSPYVLISRNFEFSESPTIEWYHANDYDGGAEIISLALTRERVLINLDRNLDFAVTFRLADKRFANLASFLRRILDGRVFVAG